MLHKKYLVVMVLLVFSSGCIIGGGERRPTVDPNNGILITSFTAEPLPAKSGDLVSFFADIENVGGTTATNIVVSLYGIQNVWKNRDGSVVGATPTVSYPDMKPPSLANNRAGDFKIASFYHMPSDLPEGVTTKFPVIARVTFDYHSTGTITIPAYSNTLYTAKKNKGEAIDIQPRVDNTHAPVQIRVTRATVPLIIEETRQNDEIATFLLEFVDVGSGSPVTDNTIGRMGGTLAVNGPGVTFSDCLGVTSGNTIDVTGNRLDLVKLRSDRRVPFGCSIRIARNAWTATMSGNIIFNIDMSYKYFVEKTVEVPVIGGARDSLASPAPSTTTTTTSSGTATSSTTTTTTTISGTCPESWTCNNNRQKLHVKADCSTETPSCLGNMYCHNYGSNDVACDVPCVYTENGKSCEGTDPHCDANGNCDKPGCGYNPKRFNYDPNANGYACDSKITGIGHDNTDFTVCRYTESTQGICAGTTPFCKDEDCTQLDNSGQCGANFKKFGYYPGPNGPSRPSEPKYACSGPV